METLESIYCVCRGKKIILKKEDYEICHFCNMYVIPYNIDCQMTLEALKIFQNVFSYVPCKDVGKIGNKIICESCLSSLYELIHYWDE